MEVEHFDRARFLVTSNGETFTVDLLEFNRNGLCNCWNWSRKGGLRDQVQRAIAEGTFVPGNQFRCPHIAAARDAMLDLFLEQLLKQFPDVINPNEP